MKLVAVTALGLAVFARPARACGVRYFGASLAAVEPRVDGRIEVVVDVMDLTGQI